MALAASYGLHHVPGAHLCTVWQDEGGRKLGWHEYIVNFTAGS